MENAYCKSFFERAVITNIAAESRRLWEQTSKQSIFKRLAGALLYSAVSNIIRNTASQIRFFKTQKK